ncbi:MAG: hypothetical protein FWB91_02845 [Defluviitaleaceae bacterium]|nr:hypothetical protein [Defluviitaleaceae bacterium]
MRSNPIGKRFIPVSEYQRISGLSYKTVMHMIKTGQLPHIETESGQYRIDMQSGDIGSTFIVDKLNETQTMVKALCRQFNTAI